MAVSPMAAAKHLARKSDWSLSNLEIQKLLYLAQMVSLGRHDSPLVRDTFEAWDYGPVLPSVYHRLKVFGREPVRDIFFGAKNITGTRSGRILDEIYGEFGHLRPGQLIRLTHAEDGAWSANYEPGILGVPIPNRDIRQEYFDRMSA